ncbi:hypothetical protein IE53DRAFT_369626 [Violaceomyces palustris]|uniref:Uncharacterized protein n=1 Tax=Violaceomyces palustris TaxID=1673888 RepID=A0ACD0NUW3_9BASI|nr:hypothetical protein IE53DRAFT_369626 [Violaceomyces palustris]
MLQPASDSPIPKGFLHASFSLRHESRLDDSPLSKEAIIEPGQLVRMLQKGLLYSAVESHVQEDGTEKPCSAPFRLVGPPHVCDGKPRSPPPPKSPTRLSPEPPLSLAPVKKPNFKEAAIQTVPLPATRHVAVTTPLVNGTHATSAPSSAVGSRRPSDDQDRSSKVASSSKSKLDGVPPSTGGEKSGGEDEGSAPPGKPKVASKDSKRKALSGSTPNPNGREGKRAKVEENIAGDRPRLVNGVSKAEYLKKDGDDGSSSRNTKVSDASKEGGGEEKRKEGRAEADEVEEVEEDDEDELPVRSRNGKASKLTKSKERDLAKKKKVKAGGRDEAGASRVPKDAVATDASDAPRVGSAKTNGKEISSEDVTVLAGHSAEVFVSAWNPTVPGLLASGSGDATVRIWDVPRRPGDPVDPPAVCKHLPSTHSKDISTLDWNPDGTLLASGSYDGILRLWTPQGDLHLVMSMHQGPIFAVRWNRKGTMLLTGSSDGTAIVWDLGSGKTRQQFSLHSDSILDVEWLSCASGSLIATSSSTNPSFPPMPHGLTTASADMIFATCSADNSINICKLGEPKPIKSFKGHTDEVNAIRIDPSQTLLASVSDDGTAKIWSLDLGGGSGAGGGNGPSAGSSGDSGRKRASRGRGGSANVDGADLEDDVDAADRERGERERERERGTPISSNGGNSGGHNHATSSHSSNSASSGNGSSGAGAGNGGKDAPLLATTTKGPNKGLRLTLSGHGKEVYSVAWCPTGPGSTHPEQPRMLATTSFDYTARIWNGDTGECLKVIDSHEDNVYTVGFSPCARFLATGGIDKRVFITRVADGSLAKQYTGGGPIFDVSWYGSKSTTPTKNANGAATAGSSSTTSPEDRKSAEGKSDNKMDLDSPLGGKEYSGYQLAIAQADRKLIVLNLADLANEALGPSRISTKKVE